jgi:hypothetical protein
LGSVCGVFFFVAERAIMRQSVLPLVLAIGCHLMPTPLGLDIMGGLVLRGKKCPTAVPAAEGR